jgi:hypothetical protein
VGLLLLLEEPQLGPEFPQQAIESGQHTIELGQLLLQCRRSSLRLIGEEFVDLELNGLSFQLVRHLFLLLARLGLRTGKILLVARSKRRG